MGEEERSWVKMWGGTVFTTDLRMSHRLESFLSFNDTNRSLGSVFVRVPVLACTGQFQDEVLTVIRRVDDNWAEGMLGDKIGIFPLLYVEVRLRSHAHPSCTWR